MKAAEDGHRYDAALVLDGTTDRSVFVERPMSPQLINNRWRTSSESGVSALRLRQRDGRRTRVGSTSLMRALTARRMLTLNSSIRYCALRPAPPITIHRQAVACPRAAQKSATYRSPRFLQWQRWCRRQAQ